MILRKQNIVLAVSPLFFLDFVMRFLTYVNVNNLKISQHLV